MWVDPIPSRYEKAHEAVEVISNNVLNREFGNLAPVDRVIEHSSHETPSIQLCDLLLGATLAAWQGDVTASGKLELQSWIAHHLGWTDLRADTCPEERKFNVWVLCDPHDRPAGVTTRPVTLLYPLDSPPIIKPKWRVTGPEVRQVQNVGDRQ